MCQVIKYLGSKCCEDLKQSKKYGEISREILEQIFIENGLQNNLEFRFDDFCQIVYGSV